VEETKTQPNGRRLVLGFDAGCMTCNELAKRIEETVGDRLEVRSLNDPQVEYWREQALGKDAPWTPTLIEIADTEVKAWTGLGMGIAFSWHLGPASTWRVMQLIGDMVSIQKPSAAIGSRLSRGQFLKGIGGAAAAVSILASTGGLLSVAEAAENEVSSSTNHKLDQDIPTMEKFMRIASNGTLALDEQRLKHEMNNGSVPQIDPRIYKSLKLSLNATNDQIQASKLEAAEIFPSESATIFSGEASSRNATLSPRSHCRGRSGRSFRWWGIRMWFDSCQTDRLIRYTYIEAGAAAMCAAFGFVPCGVVAAALTLFSAGVLRGAKSGSRIGAIVIDKSWGLRLPKVRPQQPYGH
jgi:hypothetical protein